jgi:hypothetical protein
MWLQKCLIDYSVTFFLCDFIWLRFVLLSGRRFFEAGTGALVFCSRTNQGQSEQLRTLVHKGAE